MNEHADGAALLAAKTATYGGGASAVWFGLSANEFAALVGALVAVVGLCVQIYFNRKRDKRETEYHVERMRELRDEWRS